MNTSPRRASTAAAISRSVKRAPWARRSRLTIPTIGTSRADAIVMAVVKPTRRPVKRPGPMSTATAPTFAKVTSAWMHSERI